MKAAARTIALFSLVALLGFLGCGKSSTSAGPAGGASGKGGKGMQFPVEVAKVTKVPIEYVIEAPGVIEAFENIQVTARVAGAVDKVSFSEGQEVKAGEVLAVIEHERYALALEQSNVAMLRANATVKDAQDGLDRREKAVAAKPGIIPEEEIATYRTKVALAKADVAAAAENVKMAAVNLRDASVRAPIDGIMQTRSIETGQYVQPGFVFGTLLRRDPMILRFQVSTQEAPKIKPGVSMARLTLRESQRTYTAKITLVSGAADSKSHLVAVTGEVDDKEHAYWLRPGAFCDVSITIDNGQKTGDAAVLARVNPVIPQTAIRPSEKGFLAYVIVGSVAHEKVLTLGMHTKQGLVEVTNGLDEGDLLVVRGGEALADGVAVKIQKTSSIEEANSAAAPPTSSSSIAPASNAPPPTPSVSASASHDKHAKEGAP